MFPNAFNSRCEPHDDTRRRNTNGKYVYKERDAHRGGESVSPSSPFETRYHVGGSILRPLAIYGNDSANGAWSRSFFTIFSFSREREESRDIFFVLPKGTAGGSTERIE